MLPQPQGEDEATLIGLDPGTVLLGVAELTFRLDTFEVTRIHAVTLDGSKLPGSAWAAHMFGDRFRRIEALKAALTSTFERVHPVAIATEAPFYNRLRPNAYGALMEVVCALREAVRDYHFWRHLYPIDPPTVKRAVGASGNAKKEEVLAKLLTRTELVAVCDPPIATLDEHAIDAIAVAVGLLTHFKNGTLPNTWL